MYCNAFLLVSFILLSLSARAQDTLSFSNLNRHRIQTNKTGMTVLAGWGALNIISGTVGYFASDNNKEMQSFHQMNAIWGIVNVGIAGMGYRGARKEAGLKYSCRDALHRYEGIKRLFLINAGLDIVYLSSGIYLNERARNKTEHAEVLRGYGKSLILQGAGLLLFDITMFSSHNAQDKKWYKLLQGVCMTGNGLGFRYAF